MKPHRAVVILVFGILSFTACPLFGIAAWVMGNNDLREMDNGWMDPSGRDMTKAGRICGMVGTGLLALQVVMIIIIVLVAVIAEPK